MKAAARLLVFAASAIACNLNSRLYEWFLRMELSSNDESEEEVDGDDNNGKDDDDNNSRLPILDFNLIYLPMIVYLLIHEP